MSLGLIERDQRERGIVVDNAFRPGKGSKPRPIRDIDDLGRRLTAIFKWGKQRTRRGKAGVK